VRPCAASAEQRTHDYVRHGTTTLFAALERQQATGQFYSGPGHRESDAIVPT